jgi:hypothetical protein
MTIEHLKKVLAEGSFHHATYRTDFARGLHVYTKDSKGFRGFDYAGAFSEYDPLVLAYAYQLTRKTGISLNAYGRG